VLLGITLRVPDRANPLWVNNLGHNTQQEWMKRGRLSINFIEKKRKAWYIDIHGDKI
jgi:hypothetical protein